MRAIILGVLLIAFLPIFIQPVSGVEVVFSDWKNSLDTWTIGTDLYFLSFDQRFMCYNGTYELDDDFVEPSRYEAPPELSPRFERILLSKNKQNFIISLEDCAQDSENMYCFDGVDCTDKRTKYEGGERYPGVKISITKILPELIIERTFTSSDTTKSAVEYGDEIRVDVTLRNKGNNRLESIDYWDPYPTTFKIIPNYPVVRTDSNKIYWNGWLDIGNNVSFAYFITPNTYDDYKTKANATFKSKQKTSSVIDEKTVDVSTPYEVTLDAPATMSVNDVNTITFEIENTQTEGYIDVNSLKITIPESLAFEGFLPLGATRIDLMTRDLKRDGNTFTFSGRIQKGETKKFYMRVRGITPESVTTTADISINSEGQTFTQKLSKDTKIEVQDITPVIRIEPDIIKGGGTVRLVTYIDNGAKNAYANLRITLKSDLFGSLDFREAEIRRSERLNLLTQDFVTPTVDQNTTYLVTLTGDYITFTGTPHEFHKEATLLVSTEKPPRTHSFTITHILSNETVRPGDNITVTTQIKNLASEPARGISIEDRFSAPVELIAGLTKKDLDLESQEARQAYVYKIKIPHNYTGTKIDISSFLAFQDLTQEEIASLNIDQSRPYNQTNQIPSQNNTLNNDTGTSETSTKKKDFFTIIWEAIKKLFSSPKKTSATAQDNSTQNST